MDSASQKSSDTDQSTDVAFAFLLGTLGVALLAGLWMLIQTAF